MMVNLGFWSTQIIILRLDYFLWQNLLAVILLSAFRLSLRWDQVYIHIYVCVASRRVGTR